MNHRPGLILVLVGAAWGCAGSKSAEDDDAPATHGDRSSYCGTLEARLRECQVLGAGRFECVNYEDAAEVCETECLTNAGCADIEGFYCGFTGTVPRCFQACIGLGPFTCDDGLVLGLDAKCNGTPECGAGEDEANCPVIGVYKCRNVEGTVAASLYCDGFDDCSDGSDEPPSCGTALTCDDGIPVSGYQVCDGISTCLDGADEAVGCAVASCG